MPKANELTVNYVGQTFSRLTVLRRADSDTKGNHFWECKCECGVVKTLRGSNLKNGQVQSCGCLATDTHTKHGSANRGEKTPEYKIWAGMNNRINNPKNPAYKHYGGRGLTLAPRWSDFQSFLEDMGLRPSPQHSVDRVDNNLGYSPENCRWATREEQGRNRRNNHLMEYRGESKTVVEWSEASGIPYRTILSRLRLGYTPEEVMNMERHSKRGKK